MSCILVVCARGGLEVMRRDKVCWTAVRLVAGAGFGMVGDRVVRRRKERSEVRKDLG